jgi:hypothetical protein
MNSSTDFAASPNAIVVFVLSIRTDLQPLIDDLQAGNFIGDQIPGTGYAVFKVRLKNSDIQNGKSSGYRVIYQLKDNGCILLTIPYSVRTLEGQPIWDNSL